MKIINKSLSVVLSIVMLFTLLPLNVFANAETLNTDLSDEEKYEYTIDENSQTVTITGFKTTVTGDVIIPSELNGYPVTAIGKWAFCGCSSLKSIFIPETVTEIGYEAFRSSQAVISVDENNPYFHCAGNCLIETETKTLIHGDGKSIIPDDGSVTTIGEAAFRDSDLETILIPNTITHIDHYAFSGTNLKKIVIPDSVTSMSGYCTFDDCRELESVCIGKGLESFTSLWRIFAHCDNLTSITVDKENQNFSSQGNCIINIKTKTLIAGCNNSTISNDSTIEIIGDCAFEGCSKLRSITITDNIKTIGSYAFSECWSLQSIFIPKSATSVGWGVFDGCSNLSEIKVDRDNLTYHSIDNCLIHTARKTLINGCYNSIIPADGSVEHIGDCAFYGQQNLYYLKIPEGIKTIGDSAFCSTSLYMVSLPSSLQTIYGQNFNSCGTLKYILYNGSEDERENIQNIESWEGQNSDFNNAQWYYDGTKPFDDFILSASSVECMEYVDCSTWYSGESETWIEYNINPKITITFADNTKFTGTKEEIEETFGYLVRIYDNQTRTNIWGVGKHTAKVCFLNQSVEIDVTVVEHPVERIEIEDVVLLEETAGYETEFGYLYYYVIPEYTVFFKDGSQKTVFVDEEDPGSSEYITIGGKDIRLNTNHYSLQQETPWVAGESYEVFGSFLNFSETFTVTIKEKSLTNISVLSRPDKLTYVAGEPIDTSGLVVAAYYDNGYVERITDYTISGYDKDLVGKQTITVNYKGIETTFKVNVLPINVTGVELNQKESAIILGNVIDLDATVFPENATVKTIHWESSNPAVASVDENGVVTTIKKGTAVITATTEDGAYTASCSVFVVCPHRNITSYDAVASTCSKQGHLAYTMCDDCSEVISGSNTPLPLNNHFYNSATCKSPKTCKVCGATNGSKAAHKYGAGKATKAATCKTTGVKTYTCSVCKGTKTETIAKLTTHTYSNNCDKSCNICGKTRTVGTHKYSHSCDTTCNYCNAKRTIKHTYSNNCDTSCNVCKATRTITHAYKTTTTKATLSKNGSVVKKCTVCGKVASNTTIKYAKTFQLSTTTYTYNGKAKTPSVTVKDSAGKTLKKNTDYTVTYASGRKNVGTYKVTIKMIGKYSGTKTLTFKITPAKTTVSKLTAGKKSITVAITKKSTQVTGYQIQYSTSKTFSKATTKTISSYKTTKYTLKSLSAKKTYYVRVRTYKTVGKTKYYSGWSTYKYVKTK